MALWDNSVLNTVKLSGAFNQMLTKKTVNLMNKQCGFLYAMTGGKHPAMPPGVMGFKDHKNTGGVAVEWSMLGKTLTPATIADGSAEVAARTLTYDDTPWGNATLAIPQLVLDHPVTRSDMVRIHGSEKKTESHFNRVATLLETSWQRTLNVDFATEDATGIVGVPYAIDDANVYATINRADAANVQFRGKVLDLAGAQLQYGHLTQMFNTCAVEGGQPSLVFLPLALFNSVQASVQSNIHIGYDPKWDKFGGQHVRIGNMILVLEPDLAATTVIGMDASTWVPIFGNGSGINPFTSKIHLPDDNPAHKASGFVMTYSFIQLACLDPRKNFKIKNAAA